MIRGAVDPVNLSSNAKRGHQRRGRHPGLDHRRRAGRLVHVDRRQDLEGRRQASVFRAEVVVAGQGYQDPRRSDPRARVSYIAGESLPSIISSGMTWRRSSAAWGATSAFCARFMCTWPVSSKQLQLRS